MKNINKNKNKILLIAKYTFVEIYKSKIMLNVILLGLALAILSYVASEFTFGVPARVALDFGLGALSLAAVGMAIFFGVNLLHREIENRTVYMVLSRAVSRPSFMLGKILGMTGILFLNCFILGFLSILFYLILGGTFSSLILYSIFFSFLESLIILLVVVFFSLIANITLSVIFSITIFVAGHALSEAMTFVYVKKSLLLTGLINFFSWILPNLSKINIKDFILYKQHLPFGYLFTSTLYAVLYCIMLIVVCGFIFQRKNLD